MRLRLLTLGSTRRVFVHTACQGDPMGRGHFEDRGTTLTIDLIPAILFGVCYLGRNAVGVFFGPFSVNVRWDYL